MRVTENEFFCCDLQYQSVCLRASASPHSTAVGRTQGWPTRPCQFCCFLAEGGLLRLHCHCCAHHCVPEGSHHLHDIPISGAGTSTSYSMVCCRSIFVGTPYWFAHGPHMHAHNIFHNRWNGDAGCQFLYPLRIVCGGPCQRPVEWEPRHFADGSADVRSDPLQSPSGTSIYVQRVYCGASPHASEGKNTRPTLGKQLPITEPHDQRVQPDWQQRLAHVAAAVPPALRSITPIKDRVLQVSSECLGCT